jgi:glycosyltransferase involved in cell wall biosynthesis
MQIGFLTTEYVTDGQVLGGQANYLRRLCLALAEREHEPHVFLYSDRKQPYTVTGGVHLHHAGAGLQRTLSVMNQLTRGRLHWTLHDLAFGLAVAANVRRVHGETPFDIIQAASFRSTGLFVPILTTIPMVVRAATYAPLWHHYSEVRLTLDVRMAQYLERLQLRHARHVFAPSQWLAKVLDRELGLEVEVVRTPFYQEITGLDWSWYQTHLCDQEYLLYFGAMRAHKGVHILAEALPIVWRKYPDLVAVLIGPNNPRTNGMTMRDYVRQVCQGHEEHLLIIDPLDHARLYPVIQKARLVVLPSLVDNLPNTMLEAMGLGRPIIGTFDSSFDEIIQDNSSGFLVPRSDVGALADRICEVWNRGDLDEVGIRAKATVAEQLHPDVVVPQLEAYYRRAIEY